MVNKDISEFLKSLSAHCLLQRPETIIEFYHSNKMIDNGDHMPVDTEKIFHSNTLLVHVAGVFEDTSPICLIAEHSDSHERDQLKKICNDHEEYYFNRCENVDGPFDESWWLVIHSIRNDDKRSCSMRVRFASYTSVEGGETAMIMADTGSMSLGN